MTPYGRPTGALRTPDGRNLPGCATPIHSVEDLDHAGAELGRRGVLGRSAKSQVHHPVGDAVNTAARLESLDRDIVQETPGRRLCRILIDEGTKRYLGNRFVLDQMGEVSVKGKEQTLMVYRVIGHA